MLNSKAILDFKYLYAREKMLIRTSKDKDHPYVMLNKTFLEDERISLKAKGLLAYCMSKPDGWKFYVKQLVTVLKEGRDSLLAAFNELIDGGYCIRQQGNEEGTGKFKKVEYILFEIPQEIKKCLPQTGFPYTANPLAAPIYSNKEISSNKRDDVRKRTTSSPFFDWKEGKLKDYAHLLERWRQQYPDVDLNVFIPFMESKIAAQPSRYKRYKNIDKTVIEFLKREQERINASKIKKETIVEKEKENKNNKALENRKWIIEKLSNLSKHEYLMLGDRIKIEDNLITFKYSTGYMPLGFAEENFKEQVDRFLEYIGLE